jgi:hypothetical protein
MKSYSDARQLADLCRAHPADETELAAMYDEAA